MMTALEHARDALRGIASVVTCEIGLEANISPASYPAIRLVPSRVVPGKPYAGRSIETLIYFAAQVANPEGLEAVYQGLSDLEASILSVLRTIQGAYIETLTDEDRLQPYKVMAVRCNLMEPDTPHVQAAIHANVLALTLDDTVPVALKPFVQTLHISDALDWTTSLPNGTVTRMMHGAASVRTRVTLSGYVTGPAASEADIGLLVSGVAFGNRVVVATTGVGGSTAFEATATHTYTVDAAYSAQATATNGDYTFTDLRLNCQSV
jgi:hypothetical protein